MRQATVLIAALLGASFSAGCSSITYSMQVHYEPTVTDPEPPEVTVALSVVDARAGGLNSSEIGTLRGGFGSAFPVFDRQAQEVTVVVQAATIDALAQSRVGVQDGSPRTLVATITKFWIDGYLGYGASVVVQCDLKDDHGAVLWSATATGDGGGVLWSDEERMVQAVFQKALTRYVEQATGLFSSTDFQKHLY